MAISDTPSDMLTRIRNAVRNKSAQVNCLNSKLCQGIARVLKEEGYLTDFSVIDDGRQGVLKLTLKYGPRGEVLINEIVRRSKPGRRVYVGVADLPRPLEGMGIAIVSTPKGVLSDRQARAQKVGGELLCTVE